MTDNHEEKKGIVRERRKRIGQGREMSRQEILPTTTTVITSSSEGFSYQREKSQ
jgi:hypothetical protein